MDNSSLFIQGRLTFKHRRLAQYKCTTSIFSFEKNCCTLWLVFSLDPLIGIRPQNLRYVLTHSLIYLYLISIFKFPEDVFTYPLGSGTFLGKRDILPSGNDLFLWESDHLFSGNRDTYPLGIGPLILRESDHLSSGIRDILWEPGHGKEGHALLWDSDHLSSEKHPLGIGF